MPGSEWSSSEWLTCADFARHLGARFEVALSEGLAVSLELTDATELDQPGGSGPRGQERRQFSVVFSGPAEPRLEQGLRRLVNPELGELDLFLVPVAADAAEVRYEAAFA